MAIAKTNGHWIWNQKLVVRLAMEGFLCRSRAATKVGSPGSASSLDSSSFFGGCFGW